MFPATLDELPPDWRAALAKRTLRWEGGYDPALVSLRTRDLSKQPEDAWYMTFMWLFYSRDPQVLSETHNAFILPESWQDTVISPAPQGQLPSLRAALACSFAHFYGVDFSHPVVSASVEYAFSKTHRAGPLGYLAATSNSLGVAARRWRRFKRQSGQFPYLRFRCDPQYEAAHSLTALHDVILSHDDDFWQAAMPPNDVRHIGLVEQISVGTLRRRELKVTERLPDNWRELFPLGFDRNFAEAWPDVIEADLISM